MSFCISDRGGDIAEGGGQGLFYRDTRFVSRLELAVDGQRLQPLSVRCPTPYAATFIGQRPPRPGTADSTLLVLRARYVGTGMVEGITVRNLGREPAGVALSVSVDADFAGLFEVKEGRARPRGGIERSAEGSAVRMSYRFDGDSRAVTVAGDGEPATAEGRLSWHLVIAPGADAKLACRLSPRSATSRRHCCIGRTSRWPTASRPPNWPPGGGPRRRCTHRTRGSPRCCRAALRISPGCASMIPIIRAGSCSQPGRRGS